MIVRLAETCFRHRWRTLAVWALGMVVVIVLGASFGGSFSGGGRLTGTDSDKAYRLLDKALPSDDLEPEPMVFQSRAGLRDPDVQRSIEALIARFKALPNVTNVTSPFDPGAQVSGDGRIARTSFTLEGTETERAAAVEELKAGAAEFRTDDVRVEFAGGWFSEGELDARGEIIGIAAAVIILLVAFGSILAMGIPIVTAIIGVAIGVSSLGLWARFVSTPEFTTQVAAMVGLGVGIDYALFIITRYRNALDADATPVQAIREAIGSAGRAVVFAGSIVIVSLLGMILIGLPFLHGLALGTATTVLISVLAAITLLPALLGVIGPRLGARSRRRAAKPTRSGAPRVVRETLWHRWGRLVQRRAVFFTVVSSAVLVALVLPVAWMRLASADAGNDATGSTTREAYDLLSTGFGRGVNGPLLVVSSTPDDASRAAFTRLTKSLEETPGVAAVFPPETNESRDASVAVLIPTTGPQDRGTEQLVHRLRNDVIPLAVDGTAMVAHVGGQAASDIDFAEIMGRRLPLFMGSVLAFSFLLLMLVFRSLLVPLKAVIMNLLSIGAAYGAMVAVFQWGWFGGLLGLSGGAPIEPWAPMMLFAIVFGLSMDYEVFLLSAIKERFDKTGDNSDAVVEGLASTARVITAAAAIMVMVFAGFLTNGDRDIKLIGFGLAMAVLLDATLVRMVLVPASMELLGKRNWWMPQWLNRTLPKMSIEAAG